MKKELLIRVYGDSLSMPRSSDGIRHFETYPELLRDAIESSQPETRVAVYNRSKGGVAINELHELFVQDSAYFEKAGRSILVIQCGIVDCAPRPVAPRVKAGIGRLPGPLRWAVARFLHHARPYLLRAGCAWRITGHEEFAAIFECWIRGAREAADLVYVINIAPTTPTMDRHSPGLAASIDAYNAAIASVVANVESPKVKLVDVHAVISRDADRFRQCINAADGHHLTRAGHQLYATLIGTSET